MRTSSGLQSSNNRSSNTTFYSAHEVDFQGIDKLESHESQKRQKSLRNKGNASPSMPVVRKLESADTMPRQTALLSQRRDAAMSAMFQKNMDRVTPRSRQLTYQERRQTYKKQVQKQLAEKVEKKKEQGWFMRFVDYANGMDIDDIKTQQRLQKIEQKETRATVSNQMAKGPLKIGRLDSHVSSVEPNVLLDTEERETAIQDIDNDW